MSKLSRAGGTAAAVLAVTVAAGAFAFPPRPAQPGVPPSTAPSTVPPSTVPPSAVPLPAAPLSAVPLPAVPLPIATARLPAGGQAALPAVPPGLRPGGKAILAPGQRPPGQPRMGTSDQRSLNWGGYAASGSRFRSVRATFFVPYLDCSSTPNAYSAHWAGLDGLHNNTVEQDGISADCNGPVAAYRAWYEMAPRPPVYENISIHAGDSILASVSYSSGTGRFTLSLTDTTNGHHFTRTAACPSGLTCARATAEAISEAPFGPHGYLPLADFRGEGYTGVQVISQAGLHGGLRSAHWHTTRLTTVNRNGAVLDQPTSLFRGTAFGMYWMRES